MQGSKLYVGNLSFSVSNEQLEQLFSEYGEIKQINIIEGKGFGFVEMADVSDAERAKEALDGTEFEGKFDLTATSGEAFSVGQQLTLEGVVAVDLDFGYGYTYEVLLEQAHVVE